jgi:hypothetical protein
MSGPDLKATRCDARHTGTIEKKRKVVSPTSLALNSVLACGKRLPAARYGSMTYGAFF